MKVLIVSADRSNSSGRPSNLGDAMLTDALAGGLRDLGFETSIAEFGGKRRGGGEPRVPLNRLSGLFAAIRGADMVVVGGGTLIQDNSQRALGGLPRLLFVVSAMAWISRTRMVLFGVGCDPISRRAPKLLCRLALLGREVWVRDVDSARRCVALGNKNVRLAADVSLLWSSRNAGGQERRPARALVCLSYCDSHLLSLESVASLRRMFGSVVFVQMYQGDDSPDGAGLRPEVAQSLDEITSSLDWIDAMRLFEQSSIVIASRMHGLYFGMLSGRKLVAVGSARKVRSFAKEFRVPLVPSVDDAVRGAVWLSANNEAYEEARFRVQSGLSSLFVSPVRAPARFHSSAS